MPNLVFSKMVDQDFIAYSFSNTCCCPKCRIKYTFYFDKTNKDQHVKSNRPILLPCGHNMCENCVYHNRNNLTCSKCLMPILIPKEQTKLANFNVRDHFEMNFFLMGQLNHWRYYCKEGTANNTMFMNANSRSFFNNTLQDADESVAASTSVVTCVECENDPSSGKCRICKVHYCKRCFDKIHKNSKVLRAHTLVNFDKKQTIQSELMFLKKTRFCRRHHRPSERYCKKCDIVCCVECARHDHQNHDLKKIAEENEQLKAELQLTMENAQLARENLDKAQKDVKSVETQFEEYATKTLEDISNHFLQLHSFLQIEEKQILAKFTEMCHNPQFIIRDTNLKLNEAHEALSTIRHTLGLYEEMLPVNIYLGHVLHKYNEIIQQIPAHVEINKPKSNPFVFEVNHNVRKEIQNSISYKYKDPKLSIKINSSLNNYNTPSMMDMTTASVSSIFMSPKPKGSKKNFKKKNKSNECAYYADTATGSIAPNLVRITTVRSPDDFYVQNIIDLETIHKLSHEYLSGEKGDIESVTVCTGSYYMVYYEIDKQWYRGVIEECLPNNLYKVFLVDFGITIEVSKENIRPMDTANLVIPYAAVRCGLYDILPAGKNWTEVENNFLLEVVQNKPVRASIVGKTDNGLLKVDLHAELVKSVRDSFIYTGMAREKPGKHSFKMQPKIILPTLKIEDKIPKFNICANEIVTVTALHVEGPNEFYIIKNELIDEKEKFKRDFNEYYDENGSKLQQIYLGAVQMCCAVNINDVWYRAVIEETKDKGQLYVRLVDEGRLELIKWRQVFVLVEKYRKSREFAIPCMLVDIEPLQENNYVYPDMAIKDFKQMVKNPQLRMEVVAVTSKLCKVVLYICKPKVDINIGGLLVKHKYANSTGASTQVAEIPKTPKINRYEGKIKVISNDEHFKALAANINQVKRSLIKVVHIVNPFEFYIQLANLVEGTKTFHHQIQEAQNKKYGNKRPLPYETREWYEDNHCLIYTKHHNSELTQVHKGVLLEHYEWYRGIITSITYLPGEEPTFSVYLRDIGVTVSLVYSQQLYSIDPQLDRVTNAVYRCHLACVEPAGGKTWSQSAIDSFTHYVMNAETLSVSLHGERLHAQKSLAVVLWSSRVETENPLAPCITKYSSINRHLVKKGLAYLVEPFDTKQQFDQIEELKLENGEISLDEWFKSCSLFAEEKQLHASENADETNDVYVEDHPWNKFLGEIDFSDTTGKKAPPAWLTPKIISKTIFTAYPTYIDFDAFVCLHEAEDKKIIDKITKKLTDTYGPMEPPPADARFNLGQACVVKYHADGKYYRGIITEDINVDHEWGVTFIDYGNVESVESKDIRPYAPFPNMPALASKYIIDGIKPKDGAKKFSNTQLDQMHTLIVTKFVSVTIEGNEMQKKIKRCSMRLGAKDIARDFIERGLAEADIDSYNKTLIEESTLSPNKLEGNTSKFSPNKLRKSRNPLPSVPIDDYAVFGQVNDMSVDCSFIGNTTDDNNLTVTTPDVEDDDDDDFVKYGHLNDMLERLSKNADQLPKPSQKNAMEAASSINVTNQPPPKKRLFDDNDYTKMMNDLMVYDDKHVFDDVDQDFESTYSAQIEQEDAEDDFVELGQSFAMNYWHNAFDDMREEEDEEIGEQLNRRVFSFDDATESEFESFHPDDTSTILTHFSGLENFKLPQLPSAMHHFKCRVVSIITPVILQIFPLHNEFNYRDIDLQRTIKELVKQSLPPLTNFEPHTLCLACYTKDKHWYRAVIRSYNSTAKTVVVLYVDYLNSETLPLKYVRQCPKELLSWPLRTFRVRLHGLNANPNVKDLEIRRSLQKLLNKRQLFAVVKKHPVSNSMVFGKTLNKADHIEIVLYESKEASLKGITIYDSLIENNYLRRF